MVQGQAVSGDKKQDQGGKNGGLQGFHGKSPHGFPVVEVAKRISPEMIIKTIVQFLKKPLKSHFLDLKLGF